MANGVPQLLNQIASITNPTALLVADVENVLGLFAGPKWGIGINGTFVIVPDSVVDLEYRADWQVPNYPQELGAFQSYNKVKIPFDARVRLNKGRTEPERTAFLNSIDALAQSLQLVDVVTPTKIYSNANIVHYDYRRTSSNGVTLLTVDIGLQEIRIAPSPAFSNTQQPSGADAQNDGMVQTQAAPAALFGPTAVM
jgi:hypothetical protein